MRSRLALLSCIALVLSCEDGPDQVTLPLQGPTPGQGPVPGVFVAGDSKRFGDSAAQDQVGSAKFCAETEESALAQEMVVQPIVPDVSAGSLPLWDAAGGALYADDLLGARAAGKFCNPARTYADAFTWGPTNDVILLFDPETHLVEEVMVTQQYLGAMQGTFTEADGTSVEVVAKPRERLAVGGQELDVYVSRAQALSEPRSWLNPVNVTKLYRMVRQTFFGAAAFPPDFDCVAAQICDVIYTGSNEDTPQDTAVVLRDSGVRIGFTPEGYADFISLAPVRRAPFESAGAIAFGAADAAQMAVGFQSQIRPGCALDLESALTWADFQSRCIASGDERALDRVNYNVDTARDAVSVEFNGMNLDFLRDTQSAPLFADGERPAPSDTLYSLGFTRSLPAAVSEFRPLTLATTYKARLEARLRASVPAPAVGEAPHPFAAFALTVPFTDDTPQRIGQLLTADGTSWLPNVVGEIEALYASLTPEQRALVDAKVSDPVYLIEPFVDAVLFAFTHGESDAPGAVKAFRTTEDGRWSIGFASFRRAGVSYRLVTQYSLNFGAITSVEVSRGDSAVDRLIDGGRAAMTTPYFQASEMLGGALVSLGSNALAVTGFDRQLGTLTLSIAGGTPAELQVSGSSFEDRAGYQRQIRGARYEFVPAHQLNLFGKENLLVAWVREDGTIGRVDDRQFKGALELCPGLPIVYGDDVRQKLLAWEGTVSANQYRDCDLVFNSSANGNVLFDITSIAYRRMFSVIDGRAVTVAVWE